MKPFIAFVASIIILSSCTISPDVLLKSKNARYSRFQKALIQNGNKTTPLPVMQITNSFDSTLLRTPSALINTKKNNELNQLLAQRLQATMISKMGVGIAAPQVGILKQMICVQRFDKEGFPNEIFVNPVITQYSEQKQDCLEGCLSIPGRSDTTKVRALTIDLKYQTIEGIPKQETVTGFTAVIFQHEIDHLNGILYLDHLRKELADTKKP